MAVRFILGRSGSGKTSYCIKALVEALLKSDDDHPLILLVPEQASYQAERAIFADKRITGYNRLHVLSFDRLQFLLFGKNTARPELSRIGRVMAIHKILRENSGKLKIFRDSAAKIGLAAKLSQTITELQQYAESPEDIDRLLKKLGQDGRNSMTAMKFADINLIRNEYMRFIEGKFIDSDIQLSRLCRAVAKTDFIKGASLWVDGFAGFTAAEMTILAEMLKSASETHIAICLDASEINPANPDIAGIDPAGLFNSTQRTFAELVAIIKTNKLKLAAPVILKKASRFTKCPELEHIENNIFRADCPRLKAADNIRILSAADKRAEAAFVAKEIQRLVQTRSLRYRDIAVIASDIESYRSYIKVSFNDCKIPFFIDRRKALTQHPAVNLICSVQQVIANGFLHSDIFAYLKNDLAAIERSDIDLLENYCLAFGVSPDEWQNGSDWQFEDREKVSFDLGRINEIRKKAAGPLLDLRNKLKAGLINAAEFTRIIFDFLDKLGVREKIAEWIAHAIEEKNYADAEEHQQLFNRLVDIFDELAEVFGSDKLACEDYFSILNCAFSQLSLRFIPPGLDEVLVGSIERSRHPDLKAVFLIGATHREFPAPINYDSILTDDDRIVARAAEFPLAGGMRQDLAQRQYLAYIAFTRPSRFLYVTYPSSDDAGSDVVRSQFVDNLQSLFENLKNESVADAQADIAAVGSESELAELLTAALGKDNTSHPETNTELDGLLANICKDKQLGNIGRFVDKAINYDNAAVLDDGLVESFAKQMKTSATRLSNFADCPYKYFARYILALRQREEFKLEPLDIGEFYHRVLDSVQKRLAKEKKNFADIADEQLRRIINDCVSEVMQENRFISSFASRKKHNRYIIESACTALENCAAAIAQMTRAGKFRDMQSEIVFDDFQIFLPGGKSFILRGKIDRLDVAEIDGKRVAVVFDYKRKSKSYSWCQFYYGLDMQLAIYMLAIRNAGLKFGIDDVAGAFYMPVEPQINSAKLDELDKESFGYKAKGIFNGQYFQQLDSEAVSRSSKLYNFQFKDGQPYGNYTKSGALKPEDFEKILQFAQDKIIRISEEIISGEITVRPYRLGTKVACGNCDFKSVCRFDWQINKYNPLPPIGKAEILETAGGANG